MEINIRPWLVVVILIGAGLAYGALSSFYTVQPEERAVVKRFGAVIGQTGPGLHWKIPFGVDEVQKVATERVLKQEFGFRTRASGGGGQRSRYSEEGYQEESLMLTGDLNIIDVSWVVQYRIRDPIKYLYEVRAPERTLRDISESVVRRFVGNRVGSDVLTTARVEIAGNARDEIQSAMDSYGAGIHVRTVELQDVVPPQRVRPAFNEVNEARQERERTINEAMKQRNQAIPQANGEAKRIIAEAEGYVAERVNRARGEVARFEEILGEYLAAPDVTRRRLYLETVREVIPNAGRILVVRDGQGGRPLPLYHMNSELRPQTNPQQGGANQ